MRFVGKLLDCDYESVQRNISSPNIRKFIFKQPKMAPDDRILLYPYRKLKKFFHSKQKECLETSLRVVRTFYVPLSELVHEMWR